MTILSKINFVKLCLTTFLFMGVILIVSSSQKAYAICADGYTCLGTTVQDFYPVPEFFACEQHVSDGGDPYCTQNYARYTLVCPDLISCMSETHTGYRCNEQCETTLVTQQTNCCGIPGSGGEAGDSGCIWGGSRQYSCDPSVGAGSLYAQVWMASDYSTGLIGSSQLEPPRGVGYTDEFERGVDLSGICPTWHYLELSGYIHIPAGSTSLRLITDRDYGQDCQRCSTSSGGCPDDGYCCAAGCVCTVGGVEQYSHDPRCNDSQFPLYLGFSNTGGVLSPSGSISEDDGHPIGLTPIVDGSTGNTEYTGNFVDGWYPIYGVWLEMSREEQLTGVQEYYLEWRLPGTSTWTRPPSSVSTYRACGSNNTPPTGQITTTPNQLIQAGTNVTFGMDGSDVDNNLLRIGMYARRWLGAAWGTWCRLTNNTCEPITNTSADTIPCPDQNCVVNRTWNLIPGGKYQLAVNVHDTADDYASGVGRCTGNPDTSSGWSYCHSGTNGLQSCSGSPVDDRDCIEVLADTAPVCNAVYAPDITTNSPGETHLIKFSATDADSNPVEYDVDLTNPASCVGGTFIDATLNPQIRIRAAGSSDAGAPNGVWPNMVVMGTNLLGDRTQLCNIVVGSTSYANYICNIGPTANTTYTMLEILFTNDSNVSSDKNLRIDSVAYYKSNANLTLPTMTIQAEDNTIAYDRYNYYDGMGLLNANVAGERSQFIFSSGGITYANMYVNGALRLPVIFTAPQTAGASCNVAFTPRVDPIAVYGDLYDGLYRCRSVTISSTVGYMLSGSIMYDENADCSTLSSLNNQDVNAVSPNLNPQVTFNSRTNGVAYTNTFNINAADQAYYSTSNVPPVTYFPGSTLQSASVSAAVSDALTNYTLSCVSINGGPAVPVVGPGSIPLNNLVINSDSTVSFGYRAADSEKWFTVVDGDIYTYDGFDVVLPPANPLPFTSNIITNRIRSGPTATHGGFVFGGHQAQPPIGSNSNAHYSYYITAPSNRGLAFGLDGVSPGRIPTSPSYSKWVGSFDFLAPSHGVVNTFNGSSGFNSLSPGVFSISLADMQDLLDDPAHTTYNITSNEVTIIYINASLSDTLTISHNLTRSGGSGDLIFVTPAKVVIASTVSTPLSSMTLSAIPNIQVSILAKGGIETEHIDGSPDLPVILNGVYIAGASGELNARVRYPVSLKRDLGIANNSNYPAELVQYDEDLIYNLTQLERTNPDVANFSGLAVFDAQFIYE